LSKKLALEISEKLNHDLFGWAAVTIPTFEFEFMVQKTRAAAEEIINDHLSDVILSLICAGEAPYLNPSFKKAADENGVLDVETLNTNLSKDCSINFKELDDKNFHCTIEVSIEVLFGNMNMFSKDVLEKINHIKIRSSLGEFEFSDEE
jgi:hypothetical protein